VSFNESSETFETYRVYNRKIQRFGFFLSTDLTQRRAASALRWKQRALTSVTSN